MRAFSGWRHHAPERSPERRPERGAVAVEFALLLPLLMMFLFGIIQYGYGLFQLQAFTAAVGDATASAATGVTSCGLFSDTVTSLVSGNGIDADDVSGIRLRWLTDRSRPTDRPDPLGRVQVSASYRPFRLGVPFLPYPREITRTGTATIQSVGESSLTGCG